MNINSPADKRQVQTVKLVGNGKVSIPAEFRRAMLLETGDDVVMDLDPETGVLRMRSIRAAAMKAQRLVTAFYQSRGEDNRLLSEELIADRRLEAGRE